MAALSPVQISLIQEILDQIKANPPTLPSEPEFRVQHANERQEIDELLSERLLERINRHYIPTLAGLRAAGTPDAQGAIRRCNALVDWLKEKVRKEPRKDQWTPEELCQDSTFTEDSVKVFLTIVLVSQEHHISGGYGLANDSPFIDNVRLVLDGVLDAQPFPEEEEPEVAIQSGPGFISRAYIHNYRSFVNFEWKPPAACVLVGDNGTGKSAFIEVLWILQDLLVRGLPIHETNLVSARTEWLGDAEQTIEIDIDRGEETFRYRVTAKSDNGRASIREELRSAAGVLYRAESGQVKLFGDRPTPTARAIISFDRRRSFIGSLEPRYDNKQIIAFRNLIASIWAFKPDAPRIVGAASGESTYLKRDLSNFASWYLARVVEDPEANAAMQNDLKRALKGFVTLRFEPVSPKAKALLAEFSFGETSYKLGWTELSDGQRLLIALYGLLRLGLSDASLVAIDELENYVSPSEIQPWLRAMEDAADERGQQLLVVSHHPESINYMAADAVWRMWRDPDSGHTRIDPFVPDKEAGVTAYDALKLDLVDTPGDE